MNEKRKKTETSQLQYHRNVLHIDYKSSHYLMDYNHFGMNIVSMCHYQHSKRQTKENNIQINISGYI